MVYYREHKSGFNESLKTLRKFKTIYDFKIWYFKTHNCTVFVIDKYTDIYDERIKWAYTLLVSSNQFSDKLEPIGFLYDDRFISCDEYLRSFAYV